MHNAMTIFFTSKLEIPGLTGTFQWEGIPEMRTFLEAKECSKVSRNMRLSEIARR